MDLGSLMASFGPLANAVLGAVGIVIAIYLFPVVIGKLAEVVGLKLDFHFPEDNVLKLGWLGNPLVAMYTLGSVALVVGYVARLLH